MTSDYTTNQGFATPPAPPEIQPAIAAEPIPKMVIERALLAVRKTVQGNGLKGRDVAVKGFNGRLIRFEAYETFTIQTSVAERTVSGRQPGIVVPSAAALAHEVGLERERASDNTLIHRAVRHNLEKRKDKGFALDGYAMQLPTAAKQFVLHSHCVTCHGKGGTQCTTCHGDGKAQCARCGGTCAMTCPACHGTRTQMSGQGRVNCFSCHGQGQVACVHCRGSGRMACPRCHASGRIRCQTCGATGWSTRYAALSFKVESAFSYDKTAVPEDMIPIIDRMRGQLVAGRHAMIRFVDDPQRLATLRQEAGPGKFVVAYELTVPWGEILFRMKGVDIRTALFGQMPQLTTMPPYLEKLAKKPLATLSEAARHKRHAGQIASVAQYRIIGETLAASARYRPGKALAVMKAHYPFGIREDRLKTMLRDSTLVLASINRQPLMIGLGVGLVFSALLFAAGYASGVHAEVASLFPTLPPDLLDLGSAGLALAVTALSARLFPAMTLRRILQKLPREQRRQFLPRAGSRFLLSALTVALGYGIAVGGLTLMKKPVPEWAGQVAAAISYAA